MSDLDELGLRSTIARREATIRILERELSEARQKLREAEQTKDQDAPDLPEFDLWSEDSVFRILCREMHEAKTKHPDFTPSLSGAVSIITEELGELAQVVNDRLENLNPSCGSPTWRDRAMTEAAHVAVTAIRTMHLLKTKN